MKFLLALCLVTLAYGDNPICQLKPEPGLCDAYMPKYYYEPETQECELFIYGGCGGNQNRFNTQEECEETCDDNVEYAETTCHEKADPGNCRGYFPRYYYNEDTKSCEEFIFGGCGGNDNNFETEEGCLTTCGEGSRRY